MKRYLKTLLIAITAITGISLFCACSDNDTPAPTPDGEYTKGKFIFCYGAPESELDFVHFEFKFTFLDEKGNEKSETTIVTKEGFTAQNPDPSLQTEKDLRFFRYPVSISSLPSSVKIETKIVLKSGEELTSDKYNTGQALFVYFQPDGNQYAQAWSTTLVRTNDANKADLEKLFNIYQNNASKTFVIQKSGAVSEY